MMDNIASICSEYGIDNIQWQTQKSNKSSVLFYKFNKCNEEEISLFNERLSCCDFALCIVNDVEFTSDKIKTVSTSEFSEIQVGFSNELYPIDFTLFRLLAITGTNGKTTTVDLIRQLALQEEKRVLTLGTLGAYVNDDKVLDFGLTTPAYIDIVKTIYDYQNKIDFVAVEVSSHALIQERFGNIVFDEAGWTSFSQDHLDYHKDLEEYFWAKAKILEKLKPNRKLYVCSGQEEIIEKLDGKAIEVIGRELVEDNAFFNAHFNQENLAIAKAVLGIKKIKRPCDLQAPPGRFNIIKYKDTQIIIDFAHTPDALESICKEISKSFPDKKLKTLFGCGGDRDRLKRALMAKAASAHSSFVYLTSDNPRFESPNQILDDAKKGLFGDFTIIENRKEAIEEAIRDLGDSILLIAGKGHEEYLDIKGVKHPYSDKSTVMEFIKDV